MTALSQREQQAQGEKHEMSEQAARLASERDVVATEVEALAERGSAAGRAHRRRGDEARRARRCPRCGRCARHRAPAAPSRPRRADIASSEAKLAGFERRQRRDGGAPREGAPRARVPRAGARRARGPRRRSSRGRSRTCAPVAPPARPRRLASRSACVELKALLQTQERALEEAKGELSKKRSRVHALEEMHARLEGVGAGTRALVGTRDACIAGLVADRLEAPAELTQALAGLLGPRLQHVVVNDIVRGQELLDSLAKSNHGRATIVPQHPSYVAGTQAELPQDEGVVARLVDGLRFAPEDEALVRALVGDAIVVRERACALRLREGGVFAALVTLDGTVLHADGSVSGGQGDALAAGMIDGKRETRELSEAIARLDAAVTHQLQALHASRAELAQTGAALDTARHEAHARELALVTTEKDLQKTEGQIDQVGRRLEALTGEEGELSRSIEEAGFERADGRAGAGGGAGSGRERVQRIGLGRGRAARGARAARCAAAHGHRVQGGHRRHAREARRGAGHGGSPHPQRRGAERTRPPSRRGARRQRARLRRDRGADGRPPRAAAIGSRSGPPGAGDAHVRARRVRAAPRRPARAGRCPQGSARPRRRPARGARPARAPAAREADRPRAPARRSLREVPRAAAAACGGRLPHAPGRPTRSRAPRSTSSRVSSSAWAA